MVLSRLLMEEVETVIARPEFRRYFPEDEIPKYLSRLLSASTLLAEGGEENPRPFVDDPKDEYLVELALATRSNVIVSGDRHLNDPSKELPVRVVRPADFLAEPENA
jgi:putative PIN family toxin of toxin-antitoxin system